MDCSHNTIEVFFNQETNKPERWECWSCKTGFAPMNSSNLGKDYANYETQRSVLIEYLMVMVARGDWHGVADAAMDIRELEAEKKRGQG